MKSIMNNNGEEQINKRNFCTVIKTNFIILCTKDKLCSLFMEQNIYCDACKSFEASSHQIQSTAYLNHEFMKYLAMIRFFVVISFLS